MEVPEEYVAITPHLDHLLGLSSKILFQNEGLKVWSSDHQTESNLFSYLDESDENPWDVGENQSQK